MLVTYFHFDAGAMWPHIKLSPGLWKSAGFGDRPAIAVLPTFDIP